MGLTSKYHDDKISVTYLVLVKCDQILDFVL